MSYVIPVTIFLSLNFIYLSAKITLYVTNIDYLMESIYSKLALAQEADSTWTSKIIVDIPTPPLVLNAIKAESCKLSTASHKVDKNTTDIVQLLTTPSIAVKTVLEATLGYPKGASFKFDGYNGVEDYDRLKGYLIDKASSSDGTQLVLGIADKLKTKKNS